MPNLRWLKPDGRRILSESTVHVGSGVKVRGRFYSPGQLPSTFWIWRGYSRLGTRILEMRGKPLYRYLDDVDAIPETDTSVISEEWVIPTFRLRMHVPIRLVDNLGTASPPIYASSLGGLKIGPSLQVLGTGGGLGSGDFKTAVDPLVRLRVVLPWETPTGGSIYDLIEETAADISDAFEEGREHALGRP